ncbi:hypothetical protein M433DRAFT_159562, partial [Acidomyces richmondensis BFW]
MAARQRNLSSSRDRSLHNTFVRIYRCIPVTTSSLRLILKMKLLEKVLYYIELWFVVLMLCAIAADRDL